MSLTSTDRAVLLLTPLDVIVSWTNNIKLPLATPDLVPGYAVYNIVSFAPVSD